jgi:hypothetical protein
MTIIQDRLNLPIELKRGGHNPGSGEYCINEYVSFIAGEPHSASPKCASPLLIRYTMRLNDRWSDEQRQTLLPFGPRIVGTRGDGKDEARKRIARNALCTDLLPPWLRLAGLDDIAARVEAAVDFSDADLKALMWEARDAGWEKRRQNMEALRAAVRARLAKQPDAAVAVAAAAADAVVDAVAAAAVAAAAADAVVDAVAAVAVAVAVAAAVAAAAVAAAAVDAVAAVAAVDAAAVAVAVAVDAVAAVAAAVDAAVAAAAADAVVDAVAAAADKSYYGQYDAAYAAARQYYRENPLSLGAEFVNMAERQNGLALDLLDRLIVGEVA